MPNSQRLEESLTEAEQRALFNGDVVSKSEAFEILESHGIYDISWDPELDAEFSQWQYKNIA